MDKYINVIKLSVSAVLGYLLGGCDGMVQTLALVMIIDYILGLVVAGVFKNSPKTANGAIETRTGLKGLFRKLAVILLVMVVARLERAIGGNVFCRNTVITFFVVNEVLSIIENIGLMGVKYPQWLKNSLEVMLRQTVEENSNSQVFGNISIGTGVLQSGETTIKSEDGDTK